MRTPIVLIVFNRPHLAEQVFQLIRAARPPTLLVIADGPRSDRPGEEQRCDEARAITERVDWKCEVHRDYAEMNLGCRGRIATGLDWVFSLVEEAIILEDDTVPTSSFFDFCEELLDRYRQDLRVMSVSGSNLISQTYDHPWDYYFSRYIHIWGWATWRRAWKLYDPGMEEWPHLRDSDWLQSFLGSREAVQYWSYVFETGYEGFDTWDYAWTFAHWRHSGLSAIPRVNLVSNIGFGPGATHTTQGHPFGNMPAAALPMPLHHPDGVARNTLADEMTEKVAYGGTLVRLFRELRSRTKQRSPQDP